jgi:hypothetical protein
MFGSRKGLDKTIDRSGGDNTYVFTVVLKRYLLQNMLFIVSKFDLLMQMVAILIGDVKLSMPGLQAIKREVKGQKKNKGAENKQNGGS